MPLRGSLGENQADSHRFTIKEYSKIHRMPLWKQPEESPVPDNIQKTASSIPGIRSRNKILSALPESILTCFTPHFQRVLIHQDDILHRQDKKTKYVYFIENGMISLVVGNEDGPRIEAAVVGSEGMIGALPLWENSPGFHSAVVQMPGKALRLPLKVFQEEWKHNAHLQESVFNYSNFLMAQIAQTALCGRLHSVEERLNRWLLTSRDRMESDILELTHDHIAQMLGTRRPSITIALGSLQQANVIECKRGQIIIKNGTQLEKTACDCYRILQSQFQCSRE